MIIQFVSHLVTLFSPPSLAINDTRYEIRFIHRGSRTKAHFRSPNWPIFIQIEKLKAGWGLLLQLHYQPGTWLWKILLFLPFTSTFSFANWRATNLSLWNKRCEVDLYNNGILVELSQLSRPYLAVSSPNFRLAPERPHLSIGKPLEMY